MTYKINLRLDEPTALRAKDQARQDGKSLNQFISDAVKAALSSTARDVDPPGFNGVVKVSACCKCAIAAVDAEQHHYCSNCGLRCPYMEVSRDEYELTRPYFNEQHRALMRWVREEKPKLTITHNLGAEQPLQNYAVKIGQPGFVGGIAVDGLVIESGESLEWAMWFVVEVCGCPLADIVCADDGELCGGCKQGAEDVLTKLGTDSAYQGGKL